MYADYHHYYHFHSDCRWLLAAAWRLKFFFTVVWAELKFSRQFSHLLGFFCGNLVVSVFEHLTNKDSMCHRMPWNGFVSLQFETERPKNDTHKSNRHLLVCVACIFAHVSIVDEHDHFLSPWNTAGSTNIIYHFRSIAEIVTVFMFSFTKHMPLNAQAIWKRKWLREDRHPRITSMSFSFFMMIRCDDHAIVEKCLVSIIDSYLCVSVATNVLSHYRFVFFGARTSWNCNRFGEQSLLAATHTQRPKQSQWRRMEKSFGFDYEASLQSKQTKCPV